MQYQSLQQKPITLVGSTQIVLEFFHYSINNILYQRGIYPQEDFTLHKKYGLNLLVANDESLKNHINKILTHINNWVLAKSITKLVLVISSKVTQEVLERWSFDIVLQDENVQDENNQNNNMNVNNTFVSLAGKQISLKPVLSGSSMMNNSYNNNGSYFTTNNVNNINENKKKSNVKTEKEINAEISSILRQITASVSFLPILDQECTFNILVYVNKDDNTNNDEWIESDAKLIHNSEQVKLRSFSTNIHKVDGLVSYKVIDDDDQY